MQRGKVGLAIPTRFQIGFFARSPSRSEKLRARAAYLCARVSQAAGSADSIQTRPARSSRESFRKPTSQHEIATSLWQSQPERRAAATPYPTSALSQRDRQKSIPRAAAWSPHAHAASADKTSDLP